MHRRNLNEHENLLHTNDCIYIRYIDENDTFMA